MTTFFGRLATAMVTPMNPDGSVDSQATADLARALVASGTQTIVATGTTGEAPTLSDTEKIGIWETVREAIGDRASVIAGATDNDTRHSVALAQEAERLGLDGVLLTVPAYNRPTQAGLIRHFTAIAEATRLPGMLYNVPGRTALNMTAETTLELAQVPNIVGVKEASGDFEQIRRILEQAPEGFKVWSGNDSDTLEVLRLGGYGVVSVAAHLVGRQIGNLIAAHLAGAGERAASIDRQLAGIVEALFVESNPIPVKFALNAIGFAVGPPRLPLLEASPAAQARVRAELAAIEIDIATPART